MRALLLLAVGLAPGRRHDTIGSGLEVSWTTTPTKWSNNFFANLFNYEWELPGLIAHS